jgi:hypothetical protein
VAACAGAIDTPIICSGIRYWWPQPWWSAPHPAPVRCKWWRWFSCCCFRRWWWWWLTAHRRPAATAGPAAAATVPRPATAAAAHAEPWYGECQWVGIWRSGHPLRQQHRATRSGWVARPASWLPRTSCRGPYRTATQPAPVWGPSGSGRTTGTVPRPSLRLTTRPLCLRWHLQWRSRATRRWLPCPQQRFWQWWRWRRCSQRCAHNRS